MERGKLIKYTVIFEQGPTSWGAYVPDLPGVISVGDSREEVEHLIQEAIEFHLEGMREEGISISATVELRGSRGSQPSRLKPAQRSSGCSDHQPRITNTEAGQRAEP